MPLFCEEPGFTTVTSTSACGCAGSRTVSVSAFATTAGPLTDPPYVNQGADPVTGTITASDLDSDDLSYDVRNLPTGFSVVVGGAANGNIDDDVFAFSAQSTAPC